MTITIILYKDTRVDAERKEKNVHPGKQEGLCGNGFGVNR
jgi:hypothetical protein